MGLTSLSPRKPFEPRPRTQTFNDCTSCHPSPTYTRVSLSLASFSDSTVIAVWNLCLMFLRVQKPDPEERRGCYIPLLGAYYDPTTRLTSCTAKSTAADRESTDVQSKVNGNKASSGMQPTLLEQNDLPICLTLKERATGCCCCCETSTGLRDQLVARGARAMTS